METSNPLVSSESVLMQVIHSDSINNTSQCVDMSPLDQDKSSPNVDGQQIMSHQTNFTHMMWGRLQPSDANMTTDSLTYAIGCMWNMLTNEEKELFQNDKAPSEEVLDRYTKQIMSLVNEQQMHQGSLSIEEPSRNVDTSSLENMLQTESSTWQEVTDGSSLEPGEYKMDACENPQSILNLDHIEGQVLLGIGMPEWGEVLQKDDEGRLLEMNFMSCDAEKRMLRATIVERSKEINRLQRELNTVFQIIHQLKQENEYLTQQQQFVQLQQQTSQQSDVKPSFLTQSIADMHHQRIKSDAQDELAPQLSNDQHQEFLSMQPTTVCQTPQQNDQLLLLELLNHVPPPQSEAQ